MDWVPKEPEDTASFWGIAHENRPSNAISAARLSAALIALLGLFSRRRRREMHTKKKGEHAGGRGGGLVE